MPTESAPLASFPSVDLFWFYQFKVFTRKVPRACSLGSFQFALGFMEGIEFKGEPVTGPGVWAVCFVPLGLFAGGWCWLCKCWAQ